MRPLKLPILSSFFLLTVSQKAGILHKCFWMFGDEATMSNVFFLPCLECCSPMWSSAADSHFTFLEKVVSSVNFLLPLLSTALWHRCWVSSLYLLQKIFYNNKNPLHLFLPDLAVSACNTRQAATANSIPFSSVMFNSMQFFRSFILATTKMWNGLPTAVVESSDLQNFKREAKSFLLSVAVNWFSFLFNRFVPLFLFLFSVWSWFPSEALGFIVCDSFRKGSHLKN